MSQENVEIVRGLYEAFARRDNESPFEFYDPEIEWTATGFDAMGFDPVYHGHDGVRRFWRQWLEAWEAIEFELKELVDCGDCVLARIHQTNVGRESGIAIEQGLYWQLWTLRDGKVVRMEYFRDEDEARRAAGLSE